MRSRFDEQLTRLNQALIEMGAMCEEVIALAAKALADRDPRLAKKVAPLDGEIDRMERDIEAMCLRLLLQQQPVAGDLRRISAALKMITDMERIGDQAEDIAEIIPYMEGRSGEECAAVGEMAKAAIQMVTRSVDAFVHRDTDLARKVIAYDDVVDGWFHRIKQELIAIIASDSSRGEECLDILMVAKYLERIGDHATNLAEWVEYAITGSRSKNGAPYVPAERSER